MIYTLTLNPSIDYVVALDQMELGTINRNREEDIVFGGKGINVSSMLNHLQQETTALGFIAGFTGEALKKGIENVGIQTDFIVIPNGFTRINVKIHAHEESEINGQGPEIQKVYIEQLFDKIKNLKDGDFLVLSGNLPRMIPKNIYAMIMDFIKNKEIKVIVDAFGEPLMHTLQHHPFLVKPNHKELQELYQLKDTNIDTLIQGAYQLQQDGARNVLISMAEQGAILVTENQEVLRMQSPSGKVVNSVGAGDSMVAGFLYGWLQNYSYKEALQWGIACGSASAFTKGIASKEEVEKIYQSMKK